MRELIKWIKWDIILACIFFFLAFFPFYRNFLIKVRVNNPYIDLIWVIFIILLPYIFLAAGYSSLFSLLRKILSFFLLPRWWVEKMIYSPIKPKVGFAIFFVVFISGIVLILPPLPFYLSTFVERIPNRFSALRSLVNIVISLFGDLSLSSLIVAAPLAGYIYHILSIFFAKRTKIEGKTEKKTISTETSTKFYLNISSPFPLFNVYVCPLHPELKLHSWKENIFSTKIRLEFEFFPKRLGFYSLDVVKVEIVTLPFFSTVLYRATSTPVSIYVLPKLKRKLLLRLPIKMPLIPRETGALIKKAYGSSLDFAEIGRYTPGDPISRIWWKGLAKAGKLYTKKFYAHAEDRYLLVLDLTEPKIRKDLEDAFFKFARVFIETFSRRDIEIAVAVVRYSYSLSPFLKDKKELLSFLLKGEKFGEIISPKASLSILKDCLGKEAEIIKGRLKDGGIAFSSYLFYSGILRKKIRLFYWNREQVFKKNYSNLFRSLRKTCKVLFLTPNLPPHLSKFLTEKILAKKLKYLILSPSKVRGARYLLINPQKIERYVYNIFYI